MAHRRKKRRNPFIRFLIVLLVTLLAVGGCGALAGLIVFNGPSDQLSSDAQSKFSENLLLAWIPSTFGAGKNTAEETEKNAVQGKATATVMEESTEPTPEAVATSEPTPEVTAEPVPTPDAYGLLDEDGDGLIYETINYKGSTIYLITVLDPSRVFIGTCCPSPEEYGAGQTLDVLCENFDAIGGINAGGFLDDNGAGGGWPPLGVVYSQGECYWSADEGPIAGLDENGKLYVGYYSNEDCQVMGIRDAVSFGPVIIADGVKADESTLGSGINPRTAIGQREDGAIVLMVADGRQAYSIGITFSDCADIMLARGCINATCMDGGNSSCMYYNGEQVNVSTNQAGGTRYLPDAWLIRR